MWTRLKTSFRPKPQVQILFFFTISMSSIIDREQVSKLSNKFKLVKKIIQWNKFIASLFWTGLKCLKDDASLCTVLNLGTKSIYTLKESWEQWSFRFEIKLQDFFMKKLKKFDFFDFRSQKIIISSRSRLNFWKTCQDSKK